MTTAWRSAGASPRSASSARVDPAGQLHQGVDGVDGGLHLAREDDVRAFGRSLGQGLGEAQVHRERDQVLLGAVVDVALEQPALLVLQVDQPLARRAQLVGASRQLGAPQLELRAQPGPAQDGTRLPGQPLEQALLDRRERAVLVLLDDQYAEHARCRAAPRGSAGRATTCSTGSSGSPAARSRVASGGQVAASRGRSPTTSQTCDHSAPVPSASTLAIRDGSSSAA